jgi:hypothetical protein
MAHRINEKNIGGWSLDGEPKQRRAKKKPITDRERELALIALKAVRDCLEYDPDLSDVGQNSPAARFTDGGRFLLNFSRESFEALGLFIEKVENA